MSSSAFYPLSSAYAEAPAPLADLPRTSIAANDAADACLSLAAWFLGSRSDMIAATIFSEFSGGSCGMLAEQPAGRGANDLLQALMTGCFDAGHGTRSVRVRVLGMVRIEVQGSVTKWRGKRQQRVLDLLCLLSVAGAAGKSSEFLQSQLWDGCEAPNSALRVSIHRLRKLLGGDDTVLVRGGRVALNHEKVWTDIEALSMVAEAVSHGLKSISTAVLTGLGAGLAALYTGGICAAEHIGWLSAVQRKLAIQFVSTASALAYELGARGCWAEGDHLWRRILDSEPLCESAYRGLMRSAHAQGDWAAAWSHYRFCRDTLSLILGKPPCPQTHSLARELGLLSEDPARSAA